MTKRHSSIDLLKILSMFMIVVIHLLNQGQAIEFTNYLSTNFFIFYIIYIVCYIAVNVFGILTGFLMIESKWKLKNYLNLYATVFFYSFFIYLMSVFFFGNTFSIGLLLNMLFPVSRSIYWYFSSYSVLFFLIPFLQIGIKKITKIQHLFLIIFIILLGSLSTLFNKDPFGLLKGYSAIWLVFLFIIGAYIRLYLDIPTIKRKRWIIIYAALNIVLLISIIALSFLNNTISFRQWFLKYTSPFIIISSIIIVVLFLSFNIRNARINNVLVKLSTVSFSVYIIHTHPFIFHSILKGIAKDIPSLSPMIAGFSLVLFALAIYLVCSGIDFLRLLLFKQIKINHLTDKLDNYLTNGYLKVTKYLENNLNTKNE